MSPTPLSDHSVPHPPWWRVGVCLLVCLTWAMAACKRAPSAPLRLASNVWVGYEPLYLARDLGELPPQSFRLVRMANATDVSRAFQAGVVDLAALTLDETLSLLAAGEDLRVVLVMDHSNGADALVAKPTIPDLRSLKGRRIGVEAGALGAYMLSRALDHSGLALPDVRSVPLSVEGHEAAMDAGEVDAVVTFEPVRSRLVARGGRVLFNSAQIPGEITDVLVARPALLTAHAEEVEALRQAWFRAHAYLHGQRQDAIRRMARMEHLDPAPFEASLGGVAFPDAAEDRRLREGGLEPAAQRLQDVMVHHRLLPHRVDVSRLWARP